MKLHIDHITNRDLSHLCDANWIVDRANPIGAYSWCAYGGSTTPRQMVRGAIGYTGAAKEGCAIEDEERGRQREDKQ